MIYSRAELFLLHNLGLNMIDYTDISDSVIKIFDDRIEFFNPGALYDNLTIEQLVSNDYVSKTRNKLIALMFKECGFIEKYGSGIDRIKRLCKEHRLVMPKFEEIQKGFRVTVYKEISESSKQDENEGVKSLYELILKNPNRRSTYFATELNTSVKNIERWLKQLKDEDKIEFRGSSKKGGYFAK